VIKGLYTSAAGMLGQVELQDAIANNLANCSTPGFKRTSVGFSAFHANLTASIEKSPSNRSQSAECVFPKAFTQQDMSQGAMEDTGDPTNLAIDGAGAFVVRTGRGEHLTRSGNFQLNSSGRLVTTENEPVLGRNGPIQISGSEWVIDADGNVEVDGATVDKLRIDSGASTPGRTIQGRLESSNVNTVREMVSMITALRTYEARQRAIQSSDQTLDKLINQMGKAV